MVALLAYRGGVRTFVGTCGWRTSLACFVGTLAAVPGCVSSLAVSISGWPRILPVRLESSFSRWRCAVRVNGRENILLVAARYCSPALAWPAWVLPSRLAHFAAWPGYLAQARFSPVSAVCAFYRLPGQYGHIQPHAPGWSGRHVVAATQQWRSKTHFAYVIPRWNHGRVSNH